MSKTVIIKNKQFGAGKPLICVPIVGSTASDILSTANEINQTDAQVIEWRADHFIEVFHLGKVITLLNQLRELLPNKLLLFTFRSQSEGGNRPITAQDYLTLCKNICQTGWADLLDIELSMGDDVVQELIRQARENQVRTILSQHHFHHTPPLDEMLACLQQMQDLHADIAKIAVMPQSPEDVLRLLTATQTFSSDDNHCPCITMSMGDLGKITRVAGQTFGSAMTFATVKESSAPGQLTLYQVEQVLDALS